MFVRIPLIAALGAAVCIQLAAAQTPGPRALTLDDARRAMDAARAEAAKDGTSAIAVVDAAGEIVLLERLDGTFPAAARVAAGKARTSVLFRKPTRVFEELINKGRTAMAALDDFTPLMGGVPLVIDGQVAGAIGVSGAASAPRDEEVALAGARALERSRDAGMGAVRAPAAVSFFDGATVAAAFEKGRPLLETAGFKIHASHREAPGQAEIHAGETDVIYVLRGAATFVTGGTVPDAALTAVGELRGSRIEGGTVHRLRPGDVMVVPGGVPHWFQEVEGAFDYYVVKVPACGGASS